MSHKGNKNSKSNKKVGNKTKKELKDMQCETANEIGYSQESRKLGKNEERENLPKGWKDKGFI